MWKNAVLKYIFLQISTYFLENVFQTILLNRNFEGKNIVNSSQMERIWWKSIMVMSILIILTTLKWLIL